MTVFRTKEELLKHKDVREWMETIKGAVARAAVLENIPSGLSDDMLLGMASGFFYALQRAVGVSVGDVVILQSQLAGVCLRLQGLEAPPEK